MPTRKRDDVGVILARLMLEMVRATAKVFLDEKFGASSASDVLLCTAVYIGDSERRQMTAAKLADYIGMPRPTVIRKLAELQARGVVTCDASKRWSISASNPGMAGRVCGVIDALLPLVHRAAVKLSKLDADAIAAREPPRLQMVQGDLAQGKKNKTVHDK